MDGILVLDKPGGWTSHDVVARVRRLTRIKRVGHTGTLDPMATGVLVVCLGQATRIIEYLVDHDKQYRATIRLGIETDTYDAQGRVIAEKPVAVNESALRKSLEALVGDIEQVPPMFSAIKRGGQKLVDLARKGVEVEREPRQVVIRSINLLRFDPPDATIDVRCSAGTYIRSLAHDLGRALGCGAHLSALTRTAVGNFTLPQAVPLAAFETAVGSGSWATLLRPLDAALAGFPSITLSESDAARARHGLVLSLVLSEVEGAVEGTVVSMPAPSASPWASSSVDSPIGLTPHQVEADLVRVYDPSGRIVGLMRFDATRNELKPHKILTGDT